MSSASIRGSRPTRPGRWREKPIAEIGGLLTTLAKLDGGESPEVTA
jgi:hypothetical protein